MSHKELIETKEKVIRNDNERYMNKIIRLLIVLTILTIMTYVSEPTMAMDDVTIDPSSNSSPDDTIEPTPDITTDLPPDTVEPTPDTNVAMETDKSTYSQGKSVKFTLYNHNQYSIEIDVRWPSVYTSSGECVYGCGAHIMDYEGTTIPARGKYSWTWKQKDDNGNQVSPGYYVGELNEYRTDTFQITTKDTPTPTSTTPQNTPTPTSTTAQNTPTPTSTTPQNTPTPTSTTAPNNPTPTSTTAPNNPTPTSTTPSNTQTSTDTQQIKNIDPYSNIERFEIVTKNIVVNRSVEFNFTTPELCIYQILINGKENKYDVSTRIEDLKNVSEYAKPYPPGIIYGNENVLFDSARINYISVRFRVKNSWIENNSNLENKKIYLLRWIPEIENGVIKNGKWFALMTNITRKDESYTYFESPKAGNSRANIFSISALSSDTKVEPVEEIIVPDIINIDDQTKNAPGFDIIIGMIILLIVGLKKIL